MDDPLFGAWSARSRRWFKVGAVVFALFFAVFLVGAMAFAVFEPIQVLPRIRLAPGYAFTDHHGESFTSEDARGTVVLYTFVPSDCGSRCDDIHETMRTVRDRVGREVDLAGVEFRLVTIALDPAENGRDLAPAAVASGADGLVWRWVGGDEVQLRNVVGAGFGRYFESTGDGVQFDPGFVIVDGLGVVRGDYRYQTLADDADKLVRHMQILAEELANSDGATAVAYEAAHLFLCYP